jgi:hypothetical protein
MDYEYIPMDYEYVPTNSKIFLMMAWIVPLSLCLPCWVVAKFIHEPYMRALEDEDFEEILFEHKFPIGEAENNSMFDEKLKKPVILSHTPDGVVYMKYSKENEGFEYWSDDTIRYKYLETVARKYVTIFSCKDLYIDRFALLNEKLISLREQIKKNKEVDEEVDEGVDDVFASLKSYNKKDTNKKQDKILRSDIVCEKANKYMKRGKIKDAVFGEKPKSKESESSSLSFSSWKLWRKGKTD